MEGIASLSLCVCVFPVITDIPLLQNTSPNSATVEQHRLKCSLPANLDDNSLRNGIQMYGGGAGGDTFGAGTGYVVGGADKQLLHFQQVVSQLNDSNHRLEAQFKYNQMIQWITVGLFLVLSIAIVYILKAEIKNSAAQYCMTH